MRQFSGFGTAEDTNGRYKYLLQHGETGLSVAFHLPTIYGYDSDHPMAAGEVGKVGVAVDSLADMETLFQGIPLGKVSTSMTINSTAWQGAICGARGLGTTSRSYMMLRSTGGRRCGRRRTC
jgi:methylmalonyl-CoA mutase N-terminal domain/subunit